MHFLLPIATNKYTLPFVGIVCILLWPAFQSGSISWLLLSGLAASVCAVLLTSELNTRNTLLRNGSRLVSSILFLLLTVIVQLHVFSFGHLLLLLYLLSYHILFRTVQIKSPGLSFFIYLLLSLSSFILPSILIMVPVFWFSQLYTQSMSGKCFTASVMALLVPYWLCFGFLVLIEDYQHIIDIASRQFTFHLPDYSSLTIPAIIQMAYIIVVLAVGIVNFHKNKNEDKSRVRMILHLVISHAAVLTLLIIIQPQNLYSILPLLILCTAIMVGHFLALTYTKFAHIASIAFLILSIAVFVISAFPELLTII